MASREIHRQDKKNKTQVLVLLEPEEVSHAAQRAEKDSFDLVLGHDAAALAAARGRASAHFAHGGTWVPRAVWAAAPRRKALKASLVIAAVLTGMLLPLMLMLLIGASAIKSMHSNSKPEECCGCSSTC